MKFKIDNKVAQSLHYMDKDISEYGLKRLVWVWAHHPGTTTIVSDDLSITTYSYEGAVEEGAISAANVPGSGAILNTSRILIPIINIPNSQTTSMNIWCTIVGTA